jgi:hypothetical protein
MRLLTPPSAIKCHWHRYAAEPGIFSSIWQPDLGPASIVFILTSAGLVWGLDGRLREVLARNSITRWIAGLSGPAPRGSIATGEA